MDARRRLVWTSSDHLSYSRQLEFVFFIQFYIFVTGLRRQAMLLREHPLISYKGIPSWPPTWTWTDGLENQHPRGEVGILRAVALSKVQPPDRCFLYIEHEGSSYIGCLLFDDSAFCDQVTRLLQGYCNRRVAEIGSIDVSYLL
jgi:hypothetical protein